MRLVQCFGVLLLLGAVLAVPARAATGGSIHGGGSATDMTRFALAIQGGTGHFECLMPAVPPNSGEMGGMTVEATVTGIDSISSTDATFHGTATVTLSANNPFGLPAGPMTRDASFTTMVTAGGPGTGFVDLVITVPNTPPMEFAGTVEHGQISINP
jgi:hypothetical protein